jgi:hypothetical protein
LVLNNLLIFIVAADPHPDAIVAVLNRQGAVGKTNSGRPETADFLQLERRMPRVTF